MKDAEERRVALGREPSAAILRCVLQLLVTANVVASSLVLVTLMMEATRSSETLVLTRATRRHMPEDGLLHILACSVPTDHCSGKM
jgi:hypothetical protein